MHNRSDIHPKNPPTVTKFIRTSRALICLLLFAVALFAMPCSAADGAASSDDAVVTNQTANLATVATTLAMTTPTTPETIIPTTQPTTEVTTSLTDQPIEEMPTIPCRGAGQSFMI